jgi:protein-S-isoprenylcysteine O-methyltransferase Ste14
LRNAAKAAAGEVTAAASREYLGRVQKKRKLWLRVAIALSIVVMPFVTSRWADGTAIHDGLEVLGLALIAACILGRAWCTLYIGGRKAHELVDLGPYSLTRNPLYLFSFMGALGLGMQSGSLTIGLLFLGIALAVFVPVVRREEAILQGMFGDAFSAYRARVPRFWPRITTWRDAKAVTFSPALFYVTLRDGLVFLCAVPFFELIDVLQRSQILPAIAALP